jgi:hypothetical protein
MKRTITIALELDNDALLADGGDYDNTAIANILRREVVDRIGVGVFSGRIIDANGNTIGRYSSEDE